jgi:hypothetical protein
MVEQEEGGRTIQPLISAGKTEVPTGYAVTGRIPSRNNLHNQKISINLQSRSSNGNFEDFFLLRIDFQAEPIPPMKREDFGSKCFSGTGKMDDFNGGRW